MVPYPPSWKRAGQPASRCGGATPMRENSRQSLASQRQTGRRASRSSGNQARAPDQLVVVTKAVPLAIAKMPVQFTGCNHVQVATLSQNGAGTQEVLHVGPHHCADAACKIPSQGHFNRGLQNIESAMDGTLAIRGKSMFWVTHKQTKTKWDLVRAGPTEKN